MSVFTPEQEAQFQTELDAIKAQSQTQETGKPENEKKAQQKEITADQDEIDELETESEDQDDSEGDSSNEASESDDSDDGESEEDESPEEYDDLEDEDDSSEESEGQDGNSDKKAKTKESIKRIKRLERQHADQVATLQQQIASLQEVVIKNTAPKPQEASQNQQNDLIAEAQAEYEALIAEGYNPETARELVAFEARKKQRQMQMDAKRQADEVQQKMTSAIQAVQSRVQKALLADKELNDLALAYKGPTLTEPLLVGLSRSERPGRVLKHILKNQPKLIASWAAMPVEDAYAQMLMTVGRVDALAEVNKQNKLKPKPKPQPPGKLKSTPLKTDKEGSNPLNWSSDKLRKEMGLS